jgi:hypothetical protein
MIKDEISHSVYLQMMESIADLCGQVHSMSGTYSVPEFNKFEKNKGLTLFDCIELDKTPIRYYCKEQEKFIYSEGDFTCKIRSSYDLLNKAVKFARLAGDKSPVLNFEKKQDGERLIEFSCYIPYNVKEIVGVMKPDPARPLTSMASLNIENDEICVTDGKCLFTAPLGIEVYGSEPKDYNGGDVLISHACLKKIQGKQVTVEVYKEQGYKHVIVSYDNEKCETSYEDYTKFFGYKSIMKNFHSAYKLNLDECEQDGLVKWMKVAEKDAKKASSLNHVGVIGKKLENKIVLMYNYGEDEKSLQRFEIRSEQPLPEDIKRCIISSYPAKLKSWSGSIELSDIYLSYSMKDENQKFVVCLSPFDKDWEVYVDKVTESVQKVTEPAQPEPVYETAKIVSLPSVKGEVEKVSEQEAESVESEEDEYLIGEEDESEVEEVEPESVEIPSVTTTAVSTVCVTEDYSPYCFVVSGVTKDMEDVRKRLKNLGGSWNPKLRKEPFRGWVFSNRDKKQVLAALGLAA